MSPRAEHRFPPVHRHLTWRHYGVILAVALGLRLVAVDPLRSQYLAEGLDVPTAGIVAAQVVSAFGWLAVVWPLYWLLDRLPLAPERRLRNLAARGVLVVGLSWIEAQFYHAEIVAVIGLFGIDPRLLAHESIAAIHLWMGTFSDALLLVLGHAVIQRAVEQQATAELEASLARARLQALALELQPHFLFNTLNGIAGLVREEPRTAERMIVRLSDLLRATLDSGAAGEVTLARELEILDTYIELQQMRYGDRLTVHRAIDPAALGHRVPGMLLQPLVENALRHGLDRRPGPGRLWLGARVEQGALLLSVEDDGAGLGPEEARRDGTGLGATRERLETMFDERASIELAPRPEGGTRAVVRIPVAQAEGS